MLHPMTEASAASIEVRFLSGEAVDIAVAQADTVDDIQKRVADMLKVPMQFLKLLAKAGELRPGTTLSASLGDVITVYILEQVPFQPDMVPEGSKVLFDGVLARYNMRDTGWSSRIRFDFNPPGHPLFGSAFQVKDWMFLEPGLMHFRNCDEPVQISWILPGSSRPDNGLEAAPELTDDTVKALGWTVVSSQVLVRRKADLASEEVVRLNRGISLNVEDGVFLQDADRTPRLRISHPVCGWVTPHLHSTRRMLIKPPSTCKQSGTVYEIASLLRAYGAMRRE